MKIQHDEELYGQESRICYLLTVCSHFSEYKVILVLFKFFWFKG